MPKKQLIAALVVCLVFFVLSFVAVFCVYEVTVWKAALYAFFALAVQMLAWRLSRRRSILAHALSFIPADMMLFYICKGNPAWAWACGISLVLVWAVAFRELPDSRNTTQAWLASALYLVLGAFTAAFIL